MKLRVTFKDGLELLMDWQPPKSEDGTIYVPFDMVVDHPGSGERVWVEETNHVHNQYLRLPRYHETDRKVLF